MRAANHHGRGTARHNTHKGFNAPHIHKEKSKYNVYWTWDSKTKQGEVPDKMMVRASELRYYSKQFSPGLDAQNDRHRARRQYKRIRTIEDIYQDRQKQPEESLLYIGNKTHLGDVSIKALWECVSEYVRWESEYSKQHGEFYKPLSLTLHADEDGQYHIHERGVYQYKDDSGQWQIGQARALEAAGISLPDPGQARSKSNNRKMTWDADRREKWLDIVEAHGFAIERTPEAPRPHLPLEAWQALQDASREVEAEADRIRQQATAIDMERQQMTAEADNIRKMKQAVDREQEVLFRYRQELEDRERELDARQDALEAREAAVKRKEDVMTALGRERYQKALQERQDALTEERVRLASAELPVGRSRKRAGKHSTVDRQME